MDAYVTKPIRSKELCRVIQETTHSLAHPAELQQSHSVGRAVRISQRTRTSRSINQRLFKFQWLPMPRPTVASIGTLALESVDGNRQLLAELVEIFREECPKLRAEIETAFGASRSAQLTPQPPTR